MTKCTWIGLIGYILALTFFLVGILFTFYTAYEAYKIGREKGWFYLLNKDDFIRKTPFNYLMSDLIALLVGVYYFIYPIAFIIIPKYWRCLIK